MPRAAGSVAGCIEAPRPARPPVGLLIAAALAAALVFVPLAYTAIQAAQVDPADAVYLLIRPLVGELLVNTVTLIAAATCICALAGTACAWLVERTDLPGRRSWAVLAVVPLAIPSFITSYAWVSLSAGLQDFAGALLVVSCSYFPLVYLPVAAALRGLDPAQEESARSLGLTAWGSFRRVVLPQLRPALLGGMLLVALNTLTEFGAFALLRFRTFTTELYAQYRTGLDGPDASLIAVVLVALCLLLLGGEAAVRGHARYARIGRGTGRPATRYPLGWMGLPVLAGLCLLALVSVGTPLGMIVYWLTRHGSAAISPAAVSAGRLATATFASLWLGMAGAALTVVLALPLGFLAARYDGRLIRLLERVAYLAQGVPGIVVALALVALTVQALQPLYQSAALLVIAYAIIFLPLALVGVRAAFAQAQRGLEDTARSLGLGWWGVSWRVVLPLAGRGLAAAAAMVFVSVVTELTTTLLLAPIGTRTLATEVWADSTAMAFAAASPYAALMAVISMVSAWLLAQRFGASRAVQWG